MLWLLNLFLNFSITFVIKDNGTCLYEISKEALLFVDCIVLIYIHQVSRLFLGCLLFVIISLLSRYRDLPRGD